MKRHMGHDWTTQIDGGGKKYTADSRHAHEAQGGRGSRMGDKVTDAVITTPRTSTTPSARPPRRPARSRA
ncbi:hypothetical protein QJS66_18025 [Kocuria rhizophila]|nr:hypothetical protein QJS66_18025 [Kocuria rhizophila]